jgi:hypothetical protein
VGLGNYTFQVEVWPAEALSSYLHGLRYPQPLMRSAGASRWYPSSRCGSRGGLERTGQHFARGEQAAAMPPDMVHGGVGTVRVEVTDGVLDQLNMVGARDRGSSSCPIAREQPTIKQVPIGETS